MTTAAQGKNIWVRKYNPNGGVVWTQSIDGSPLLNLDDYGYGAATNAMGEVFVAASAQTTAGQNRDILVAKLDAASGNVV